ncbi:unnamed protein product [Amoebophrya sp. A120]|nr:unnamed protein product [Amoebophrya sp. A120]|eukprot:GSA120T00011019001.1
MAFVNPRVWLDVSGAGRNLGRLEIELFHDVLPITSENFRALCTGETGLGYWMKPRWYKGTRFHRVIPGFMAQGGDFNYGNGEMGESIYGKTFRDENFLFKHSRRGLVSMSTSHRKHTNNSQFFFSFNPLPHLDGKHVVFGQVVNLDAQYEAHRARAVDRFGTHPLQVANVLGAAADSYAAAKVRARLLRAKDKTTSEDDHSGANILHPREGEQQQGDEGRGLMQGDDGDGTSPGGEIHTDESEARESTTSTTTTSRNKDYPTQESRQRPKHFSGIDRQGSYVLDAMERMGSEGGFVRYPVEVWNCGEYDRVRDRERFVRQVQRPANMDFRIDSYSPIPAEVWKRARQVVSPIR